MQKNLKKEPGACSNLLTEQRIDRMAELRDSAPGKDSIPRPRACRSREHSFRLFITVPPLHECLAVLPSQRFEATAQFQAAIVTVWSRRLNALVSRGWGRSGRWIDRNRSRKRSLGSAVLPETLRVVRERP